MFKPTSLRTFVVLLAAGALSLASTGCHKADPTPTAPVSPPHDYQVEYRVTSATDPAANSIFYSNETGNIDQVGTTVLPYSRHFTRNMKGGDEVSVSATLTNATAGSEITTHILLDSKEVKTVVARGAQAQAICVYVIGQ